MQEIPIRQIACGHEHTLILTADNNVFVFGDNYFGQLGLNHNNRQNKPVFLMNEISQIVCGAYHTFIAKKK